MYMLHKPSTRCNKLHSIPYVFSSFPPFSPFSFRFKGVLQLDPTDAKAMSSLALAYVDKGDTEEATHWLRQTVDMNPTSRAPLYNLAVIMTRSNRHAEAVPLLDQLLVVGACIFVYVHIYLVQMCTHLCLCVMYVGGGRGRGTFYSILYTYVGKVLSNCTMTQFVFIFNYLWLQGVSFQCCTGAPLSLSLSFLHS